MLGFPVPPPLERDPATGSWRAIALYSAPMHLLWTLVIAFSFYGLADHSLWVAAGALAAVLIAVEVVRRYIRGRRSGQHP